MRRPRWRRHREPVVIRLFSDAQLEAVAEIEATLVNGTNLKPVTFGPIPRASIVGASIGGRYFAVRPDGRLVPVEMEDR